MKDAKTELGQRNNPSEQRLLGAFLCDFEPFIAFLCVFVA